MKPEPAHEYGSPKPSLREKHSPKAGADTVQRRGDELKLVYPQTGAPPEDFRSLAFTHFLLQPMDGPDLAANTAAAIAYCKAHPRWRISLQTHKLLGIP